MINTEHYITENLKLKNVTWKFHCNRFSEFHLHLCMFFGAMALRSGGVGSHISETNTMFIFRVMTIKTLQFSSWWLQENCLEEGEEDNDDQL